MCGLDWIGGELRSAGHFELAYSHAFNLLGKRRYFQLLSNTDRISRSKLANTSPLVGLRLAAIFN